MRNDDRVRILHMIEATESVEQFAAGRKRGDLDVDKMLLFAILRAIEVVDLSVLSKRAKRINITVPENLLRKIDAFAMKDGDSRSGLLVTAALQYIAQKQRA